jgi:hypothetical protein
MWVQGARENAPPEVCLGTLDWGKRMTHPAIHPKLTWVTPMLLLVLAAGCAEPFIVMSGKALSGTVRDAPVDWSEHKDVEIVQIETRPSDPYSVNIWMVGIGSDVYIATGADDTNWTEHVAEDPDVRLRIRDEIFELEAARVIDDREKRAVVAAYVKKYDLNPDDNWVMDGQVFRLDRR